MSLVTRAQSGAEKQPPLQADRFHLASIVEYSSDAIVSVNLDGDVISWNKTAERLFGYAADEIIGRPVALLFPPDRPVEEAAIMDRLKRGEIIAHYETHRVRKDGGVLQVSMTASPIRDATGQITGISKIVHDVTEERRAQEDLKILQAEMSHMSRWNMMGTIAASLAHELNQPLTATLNYVGAARRMMADRPECAASNAFLDKAMQETRLAGGIIRSLRAFIEKRETPRVREDINAVIEDGLALGVPVGADARKKISKTFEQRLPPVEIDRIQVQQVLLNLVRNALEAMQDQPDGRVSVKTALGEPGFVLVSVADTGPGLAPEVLESLFKPFVTTKKKGMGVGLSICQSLIEAHGGRIWTEPNKPHGIVFRFQLPIAKENHAA